MPEINELEREIEADDARIDSIDVLIYNANTTEPSRRLAWRRGSEWDEAVSDVRTNLGQTRVRWDEAKPPVRRG